MAGAILGALIAGGAHAAGWVMLGKTVVGSMIAGASLGYALTNRPQPVNPISPTYDFHTLENTSAPTVAVPIIYGRNKVAGNIIYRRLSEDKKHLYYAVGIGEGRIESIYDLRVNDRPIEELGDTIVVVSGNPPVVKGRAKATVRSRQGFPGGLTITWKFNIMYRAVGTGVWLDGGQKTVTSHVSNVLWGDEYRSRDIQWEHELTGLSGTYETQVQQVSVTLSNSNWELWGDTHVQDVAIAPSWEWYVGTDDQQASQWVHTGETFRHTAYIAFHFRDAEPMGGREPKITSIVDGLHVPVWNGSEWVTEYSRNPAWCVLDFLRNPRYGMGVPDSRIDFDSFITAAEYCDEEVEGPDGVMEPRFRLDYVIDAERSALDTLEDMLATFRAFITYSDGKLRLRIERYETPVFSFTNDNIIENSFSYSVAPLRSIPNQIRVEWINPEANFERSEVVYDNEADQIRRGEVVSRTIPLLGITRASQAGRMARFLHDSAYRANTFCEFRVGIDALHVEVGDVVLVSHDVPGWVNKQFRVLEIEEMENDEARLRLREYVPAIYHDGGVPYQDDKATTLPNPLAPPPHVSELKLEEHKRTLGDGSIMPVIRVTWREPVAAYYAGAVVYWRKEGDALWQQGPLSEAPSYDILLTEPAWYEVRVVSQSVNGMRAPFDTAPEARINVEAITPPNVTGLRVDFTGPDAIAVWNAIPTINKYRVRILHADTDEVVRTEEITGTSYTYRYADNVADFGAPNPEIKVSVEALSEGGVPSEVPTVLLAVNPPPPVPVIGVFSGVTQVHWWITSPLPSDWASTTVTFGTYTETAGKTSGVIDASDYSDQEVMELSVFVTDLFGQNSGEATRQVRVEYLDREKLSQELRDQLDDAEQRLEDAEQRLNDAEQRLAGAEDGISNVVSEITRLEGEISAKVSQTVFDTLAGVVSDHAGQLSVLADQVAAKVEQTVFDTLAGVVADHTGQLSVLADEVSAKVEKTVFDALADVVTDHAGQLSVLADQVAAKVEQTVFDALADTVSAHSGQLTVLSNEIATKVERTEFDAVENRLSHAESTITQQAEMLEFRVVAYDENGEVSGAKLRISNVDGEGRIYLDAETIVSGVLKILGEMAIEVGDGTIRIDATGLHAKKGSQPTFRINLDGDAWFGGDVEARTFILPVRSS